MTPWSSAALALLLLQLQPSPAPGASDEKPARLTFERPCMGTLFRIVIVTSRPAAQAKAAAEGAFEIGTRLDSILSDYKADSEVGRFNRSKAGEPQKASAELIAVYKASVELQRSSRGAFDPARGALTWQWRLARRTGELPAPEALKRTRAASGIDQIHFDAARGEIARRSPDTKLDFGGIAKGYAADRMLDHLREQGFASASVAAGGDLALGDAPPGVRGWKVAIEPSGLRTEPRRTILLANVAISTSGAVEQSVVIDGKRYSHIIDPHTGLGLTAPRAASVIAPSATESDALATALCILGKPGLSLIQRRENTEAAIFSGSTPPVSIQSTPGFPKK